MKEVPSSGYFSGFGALVASGLGKIYIACDPPIDGAGLDLARPVHKEGLANDAFKQGSSFAAISCGGVCPEWHLVKVVFRGIFTSTKRSAVPPSHEKAP